MFNDEPVDEFMDASAEVEEAARSACAKAVCSFAVWVEKNWKMSEDEWKKSYSGPPPTGSYWDGYNAAIEGMRDAAGMFTGTRVS